jgi:hypothetical protein
LGRTHTRWRVCFGGFYLRFADDTAEEIIIDLSAADDRRSRLDNHLCVHMRVEN